LILQFIEPTSDSMPRQLAKDFVEHFGSAEGEVRLIRSPYRLCPVGAHVDHQLGVVSAVAVDNGIHLAFAPNPDHVLRIISRGYPGLIEIKLENFRRVGDWADYARGALLAIGGSYTANQGVSILVDGQLSEAGISSSAAVGLGYLLALSLSNGIELDNAALIEFDRIIENDFIGLKNGILDQSAITLARKGQLTVIDCKQHSHTYFSQLTPFTFLAVYSGVKEPLVQSNKFNNRVDECFDAGSALARLAGGEISSRVPLGATTFGEWEEHQSNLIPIHQRRARHFFTESKRVLDSTTAWEQSDHATYGEIMDKSCQSSIMDYETGSPEMIELYECLANTDGVYGARFSGAGFRGCAVALVNPAATTDIIESVAVKYWDRFPHLEEKMWAFTSHASQGLGLV
jgi:galacturonokinase